jgi:hypothetical protein
MNSRRCILHLPKPLYGQRTTAALGCMGTGCISPEGNFARPFFAARAAAFGSFHTAWARRRQFLPAASRVRSLRYTGRVRGWPATRSALPVLTQCMVRPCGARDFVDPGDAVLHQCIRPLIGACAPGPHGYQRACDLISGPASNGAVWVTSVRTRWEDRSSIVVSSSRRPRRVNLAKLRHR